MQGNAQSMQPVSRPAGSHGVWGLDDYQFLPFIWGSAQLIGNPMIKPKSIHSADVLSAYSKDFFYLAAVQFVTKVRAGTPCACDAHGLP